MTLTFGRRQLIVALIGMSVAPKGRNIPFATQATDAELARINERQAEAEDRRHWESTALLYGGPMPR